MSAIDLIQNDCVAEMATMPEDSFDSTVTDPPYHLTTAKRFGKPGAKPPRDGDVFARSAAGFMGQAWDGGDVAFRVETWREVLRVLKPGAHLAAFGGSRTYHRMACAIEDAGFEIRDCVMWIYGTGFPKSRDIGKEIDKRKDWTLLKPLQTHIKNARLRLGMSQSEAARHCGIIGPGEVLKGGGFMWFETGYRIPTREQFAKLTKGLGLDGTCSAAFENAERMLVGQHIESSMPPGFTGVRFKANSRDITAALRPESLQWQGWGTSLKPAHEPVVIARKPIDPKAKNVAHNVLMHETGAFNIDACRIDGGDTARGRWPANVVHDGDAGLGDAGRFFYSAKASKADRAGSKHPTVKPIALMQWLCRLITPPGGHVLDPFAGSGTTGEAALREGFGVTLIEQNPQYYDDIERRLFGESAT